jgi:proteasome beta subunit
MFLSDGQGLDSISPFSRRDFDLIQPRRHVNSQIIKDGKLQVLKGTTTIGVVCKDGVVLTTDTRATMGSFVAHKHAKKVYEIDRHLAMTIAGVVGDAQAIVEMLRANSALYKLDLARPIPVNSAARLVSNVLFQSRYYPLGVQALIGGMDDSGGHIFMLDPLGSMMEEKFVSTGSGSPVAYGVLESEWKDHMSVKESVPVVVRAIDSAMKRDSASGDSFDVALITRDGYRELTDDEKKHILHA